MILPGLSSDGKSVVPKTLKAQLVRMCQDPSVQIMDKLRLMMIYIISQGDIQASTRKELMKNIDDRLQKAIRNLENLGVELSVSRWRWRAWWPVSCHVIGCDME